jgi:hypothetical protein
MRDRRNGAKGRVEIIEMNTRREIGIEIPIGHEPMANTKRRGS